MSEANDDVGLLAGYLVASIPFLAGGIARGAMAISSQATSYLNPSQNAAEEAAREASTGNIALGNSSFDNQTVQTRQHDQWNQAPSFTYGAAQTRAFNDTGTMATSFAGNQLLDVPVSKLPFMPQVTQSVATEAAKVASETRSRGETLSNQAVQSVSNAVTRFQEFRRAMSTDHSVSDSYGNEDRANISSTFNEVDQASKMLQTRFGLRAEVADSIAVEKYLSGSASLNASAGGSLGIVAGAVSASGSGGIAKRWTNSDIASISKDGNRIQDALEQWSNNRSWSKNRDTFQRSIVSDSEGKTSSTASGISSSLTQAQNLSQEARRYYDTADRFEQRWSAQDGRGVSGALNTSDAFLSFARSEIANTPLVFRAFDPANATHWSSNDREIASERGLLIGRYIDQIGRDIRAEVDARLVSPDSEGIAAPSLIMSGGLGVHGVSVGSSAARSRGRASGPAGSASHPTASVAGSATWAAAHRPSGTSTSTR